MRDRRWSSTRWIVSVVGPKFDLTRLGEFNGRDWPFRLVASDRDSQAVHFVKPNALHRTGLSIREHDGLANKLSLGLLELAENRRRTELYSWHWSQPPGPDVNDQAGRCLHSKGAQVLTRAARGKRVSGTLERNFAHRRAHVLNYQSSKKGRYAPPVHTINSLLSVTANNCDPSPNPPYLGDDDFGADCSQHRPFFASVIFRRTSQKGR